MIKKTQKEWQEIARRGGNHAVLIVDYLAESFKNKMVEKKMKWGFSPQAYRQFDGARWMHKEDVENYYKVIKNQENKNPGYLLQKAKEYERLIKKIRHWGIKTSRIDFKNASNLELEKIFDQYVKLYMESNGFIYNYVFINDFLATHLSEIILKKQPEVQKQTDDLYVLISPIKKTESREEKEALVKLAKKIKFKKVKFKSKSVLKRFLKRHLDKFAHLNRYIYYGQSYTEKDIEERLKNLLRGSKLKKTINELMSSEYSNEQIKKLLRYYKFKKPEILKIQAARYWAYVPNFWDETFIYLVHHLMGLFNEIASRLSVKYHQLIEMRVREIRGFLEKNQKASYDFKKELARRFKDSALILENGKITFLVGQKLKKYYEKEKRAWKKEARALKIRELRGQAASPGKAKGKVSVVYSVNDIAKVKKGDVLVANATTPMHVPAMEKAVAIIADEGGLLSHAAIVSREMGIPCVVGVKIATKVLRDGNLVEVDATAGIIKKL